MKFITENIYCVTFKADKTSSEQYVRYIANDIIEAINLCKEQKNYYKDLQIVEVQKVNYNVYRPSTKTITIEI